MLSATAPIAKRKAQTRSREARRKILSPCSLLLGWLLCELSTNGHEIMGLELFKERIVDAVSENQPDQYVIDAGDSAIIGRSLTFGFIG
jgi:hypothetical protein